MIPASGILDLNFFILWWDLERWCFLWCLWSSSNLRCDLCNRLSKSLSGISFLWRNCWYSNCPNCVDGFRCCFDFVAESLSCIVSYIDLNLRFRFLIEKIRLTFSYFLSLAITSNKVEDSSLDCFSRTSDRARSCISTRWCDSRSDVYLNDACCHVGACPPARMS